MGRIMVRVVVVVPLSKTSVWCTTFGSRVSSRVMDVCLEVGGVDVSSSRVSEPESDSEGASEGSLNVTQDFGVPGAGAELWEEATDATSSLTPVWTVRLMRFV